MAVGGQQGVLYEQIFAGVTQRRCRPGTSAARSPGIPYCLLPRAAVPDDPAALLDPVTWPLARWRAQLAPAGGAGMTAAVWGGVSVGLDLASFIPFIWAALSGPARPSRYLLVHVVG